VESPDAERTATIERPRPGRRAAHRYTAALGVAVLVSIISAVLLVGPSLSHARPPVARTVVGVVFGVLAVAVVVAEFRVFLRWPDPENRKKFRPGQLGLSRVLAVWLTLWALSPLVVGVVLVIWRSVD